MSYQQIVRKVFVVPQNVPRHRFRYDAFWSNITAEIMCVLHFNAAHSRRLSYVCSVTVLWKPHISKKRPKSKIFMSSEKKQPCFQLWNEAFSSWSKRLLLKNPSFYYTFWNSLNLEMVNRRFWNIAICEVAEAFGVQRTVFVLEMWWSRSIKLHEMVNLGW